MDDPRRQGAEPTQRFRRPYPPYTDPAYGGQSPYTPPQGPPPAPNPTAANPTATVPRGRSKTPRWLWIGAAAAVLLVVALVIALVIANGSSTRQTAVSPLPATPNSPSPASTTSVSPSSSASSTPSGTATSSPESGAPSSAGATDAVVYNVTGEGRAISITYRDSGDVTQTEFNVELPWSKEVNLPKSGNDANVTIVNIGHDITCTLTVAGVQVRQRTSAGLTVCDAPA